VDQLQAFNPTVNPLALTPGVRPNLWQHLIAAGWAT
jgi:hypothetical protein